MNDSPGTTDLVTDFIGRWTSSGAVERANSRSARPENSTTAASPLQQGDAEPNNGDPLTRPADTLSPTEWWRGASSDAFVLGVGLLTRFPIRDIMENSGQTGNSPRSS
jgi:hypothetical protein